MKKYLSFLFILSSVLVAQKKVVLFPDDLNIKPLTANYLEPKVGCLFMSGKNNLRLDIGNSKDILHISEKEMTYSFGADFFTFTKLRGEQDFHFPVDAVDYLFGINAGIKVKREESECGLRFRLSHISAHFVDGHYDHFSSAWRNGQSPRVYSREFLEFLPYYSINDYKIYAGYSYLFHVVPKEIGRNIFQIGGEKFFQSVAWEYVTPFISYDLKLSKIEKYAGTNSLSVGVKVGKKDVGGISFMVDYFSGYSVHGEYFDTKEKYTAFRMNVDI